MEKEVILESGIRVKPVYGPEDLANRDPRETIGEPGEYPYTRGIHPLMYRKRPFTMRQYAGFGTPEETNQRFKFLIENGQNALNVAFDLPTQMGLDSNDPLAEGEVGRVGMALDTLADMEVAFEGIAIDKISVSLTINALAAPLMAMYFVVAEKQGIALSVLRGTSQNDILKEFIGRGAWVFPVEPAIRLIGDTIEFCAREVPNYYPVSVCGYHIRESGANPVQEIAYAYCIAREYLRLGLERGLDIDDFGGRLSFNFDIFGNLFEQVAKFRAARRLWARITKEEFGAKDPRTMKMKMIAGGGGGGLTIEQPDNNIVRGAYYALISALSGAQTMALCSFDEAYTIPTERAALISLRTMQILVEELGLSDTVDPLAGSYYVETLTNQLEERIQSEMKRVDEDWGGIVNAVREGLVQREISHQAWDYERRIQDGSLPKVGVNRYRIEEETREVELHTYQPEQAEKSIQRTASVIDNRNAKDVEKALEQIRAKASAGENIMPTMMDAVRGYATLGEITGVLKEVYGVFQEPLTL
jgi:methylmalonyl-CoA mutase N-terminal domain/subunit